ncbi:MAG TPA: DUF262 domain-containing HNH endonuclease family protein [Candidatus Kapabacteria bacterium]|nr:DUF262 domain-containing HNH endonuclease family protein [Candidatus Kapabacteria bacterium]
MITANKDYLSNFFFGQLQFVVPFFQRSYVWTTEEWQVLWDHITEVMGHDTPEKKDEHFIGTLITKQRMAEAMGEQKHDLIDGQQRLTTFAILLRAIAAKATGKEPYRKLRENTMNLLQFEDSKGQLFYRLVHSRSDQPYFNEITTKGESGVYQNQEHRLLMCFRFFLQQLEDYNDEKLDRLRNIILQNVPVINMLLSPLDDEQEIFDTINSLGIRLTTGELLKNFVFKEELIQPMYEDYWYSVFEEDDESIEFWNKRKSSGRQFRANIENLLFSYLIIKRKSEVKLDKLFNEYKKWLRDETSDFRIDFLDELRKYAEIYRSFPEGSELNEISYREDEARFFHVIENLEINTVLPLVLYVYLNVPDLTERIAILKVLESYLVRRNICRLTTKNYNNVFLQLISKLEESADLTAKTLSDLLSDYTEDTNKMPSDIEMQDAMKQEAISNDHAREILFCISLYHLDNPKQDNRKLSSQSFSVEHILPQKWEAHWTLEKDNEEAKVKRNRTLKTIGNLTLLTKSLNSTLRNADWITKRDALKKYSSLKITTDYLELTDWNEATIEQRANDLYKAVVKIWPSI